MTARREAVLAALKTRLDGVTGISGLSVERNRRAEVKPGDCPLLILRDDGRQEVEEETFELKIYAATVTIEGYVAASSDAAIGTDLNALYAAVVTALEADKDLAGAAMGVFEVGLDTEIDREDGHARVGVMGLEVTVQFQTARGNPEQAPF